MTKYKLADRANALTIDQLNKLVMWHDWHHNSHFQKHSIKQGSRKGRYLEMNLRGLLAMYNASANYDGLGSWLDAVKSASKRYRAIRNDKANWTVQS